MERLGQSDLQSLLAFVRDCYSIPNFELVDAFVPGLIAACQRLIPSAHVMTYNEMCLEKKASQNYISVAELATAKWDDLWKQHMHEHPVLSHVAKTNDRHARCISDFLSPRQLRQTGLHHDFYRLLDINGVMCLGVSSSPQLVVGVAWHCDRVFTERERLLADLAGPHIAQAWQNAKALSHLQSQLGLLRQGFQTQGAGVIVCNTQGQVHWINAQAVQYLTEFLGAGKQTERLLPDELWRWVRAQTLPVREPVDAPAVRSPLVLKGAGRHLIVRLFSQPDMHMLLLEEERLLPETDALAASMLTAREAEVLHWIARGKTNREIAIILEMQTPTAKKHVEHILAKLGVETRTAAAAIALGGNQPDHNGWPRLKPDPVHPGGEYAEMRIALRRSRNEE